MKYSQKVVADGLLEERRERGRERVGERVERGERERANSIWQRTKNCIA